MMVVCTSIFLTVGPLFAKAAALPSMLADLLSSPMETVSGSCLTSPCVKPVEVPAQKTPASEHEQTAEKVECLRMTVGGENLLFIRGQDTEEDLLPASPMPVNYLSPEKSAGEGFAAPEKVVECAASSKMKGRRIAMKTPCK